MADPVAPDRGQRPDPPVLTEQVGTDPGTARALLLAVPDLMFRVRSDGTFVAHLSGAPDKLYVPPEQFLGKKADEVLPPEVAALVFESTRRALSEGRIQTIEYALDVGGVTGYFESRVVAIGPDEMLHIIRDTTDRWRAEERLRLSQSSIDQAGDEVFWVDPGGCFVYVNDTACRELGYSREELLALGVMGVDPAFTPEAWRAHWREICERKQFTFEAALRRKNGEIFPAEITVNYQVHVGREYNFAFVRDISRRKQAEQRLVEKNRFLSTVIESLSHPFYVVDVRDRSVTIANSAAGRDATRPGVTCHLAFHGSPVPCETCPIAQIRVTRAPVTVERTHPGPGGDRRIRELHAYPIFGDDGEVAQVIEYSLDITEARLGQEQLVRAKAEAEQATRAKDHFIATLSHELRTPLAAVLAGVQVLQRELSPDRSVGEALAVIQRNLQLEARLMDDLLDLTRIARGQIELRPVPTDAHEAIQQVADILHADRRAKQLTLELNLSRDPHHVQVDPVRLHQMLWNLLRNAMKFTPEGGRITISTVVLAGELVVRVRDSGIGIEPDVLARIFEPSEGTRPSGGLGLGLSITRRLAELYGGSVVARSEGRGRGAELELRLPVACPTTLAPEPPRPLAELHCRILLVEDDADSAAMLARLLRSLGCQVRVAHRVASALEAAAAEPFDVLLSDVGLPDGSGYDLMREISARQPLPGIALTGFGMESDVRRSQEAGFAAHLTKPADIATIEEVLQRLLAARR